ncbi:hypothetical protein BD626DRAFT_549594 [Schizophyllum amplum]|uniref:Protein kinase domain-containing protein n=1 Tax=Schizophyllum amplum TaxID=97359 RepID=A0A550C741_9AGAR|nr:hypothetical protein BD626DRAFT_549594 [Auriculariopsis ampla]
MALGQDGQDQLDIWRDLATAPRALLSDNHTLPLMREFNIGHIRLGVFPRVSESLSWVYLEGSQNSVGDVLDMILQALEGLAYIHSLGIAHRDAFKTNFLVQFWPESLITGVVPAVRFPEDCPPSDRVCTGLPLAGSITDGYRRNLIPEMLSGEPYDPFKLDVWQLATSLVDFDSTLGPVEAVLDDMASMDPTYRLTANEALSRLRAYIESVPPKSLLFPPVVHKNLPLQ